jgi:hypothetical protein
MCKKIIGGITVIAIAAVAVWNVSVNLNSQKNELSDISLANVEALATEIGLMVHCCGNYGECARINYVTIVGHKQIFPC